MSKRYRANIPHLPSRCSQKDTAIFIGLRKKGFSIKLIAQKMRESIGWTGALNRYLVISGAIKAAYGFSDPYKILRLRRRRIAISRRSRAKMTKAVIGRQFAISRTRVYQILRREEGETRKPLLLLGPRELAERTGLKEDMIRLFLKTVDKPGLVIIRKTSSGKRSRHFILARKFKFFKLSITAWLKRRKRNYAMSRFGRGRWQKALRSAPRTRAVSDDTFLTLAQAREFGLSNMQIEYLARNGFVRRSEHPKLTWRGRRQAVYSRADILRAQAGLAGKSGGQFRVVAC